MPVITYFPVQIIKALIKHVYSQEVTEDDRGTKALTALAA